MEKKQPRTRLKSSQVAKFTYLTNFLNLRLLSPVAAFGCFWLLVAAFTGHREHQDISVIRTLIDL
jgi:hypothetical protein